MNGGGDKKSELSTDERLAMRVLHGDGMTQAERQRAFDLIASALSHGAATQAGNRDSIIEECAKVCDAHAAASSNELPGWEERRATSARIAVHIRSLKNYGAQSSSTPRIKIGEIRHDGPHPQLWFDGKPIFGLEDWEGPGNDHIREFSEYVAKLEGTPVSATTVPKFSDPRFIRELRDIEAFMLQAWEKEKGGAFTPLAAAINRIGKLIAATDGGAA